jgi:hypothetical protein
MSIFEQASRAKCRFPSIRGLLSVEDLWDLPLTARNGLDLNSVAKAVNAELKLADEESFVETTNNPAKVGLQLQMDIVKHVIAVRIKEAEDRKNREQRLAERQRLLAALEQKQDESLRGMSAEDILKRIAEIDNVPA